MNVTLRHALALALALPSTVAANAIGSGPPRVYPAPQNCPPGAHARTGAGSHGLPSRCQPSTCESDEACNAHGPCREMGVCIVTQMMGHGGQFEVAAGTTCETDTDCADLRSFGPQGAGPRCEVARRCAGLPGDVPTTVPAALGGLGSPVNEAVMNDVAMNETALPESLTTNETDEATNTTSAEGDEGCGCGVTSTASAFPWAVVAVLCVTRRRRTSGPNAPGTQQS